ncbi:MAG: cysteine synthase A [Phycisphaerales bacterium]|nr:MAG: cysteine synthase A [Phycisphaerales bacterium]
MVEAIHANVCELIGNTPLIQLDRFARHVEAELVVKMEAFNPGSSVKDRIALAMIEAAEEEGLLPQGSTIIEPTSGNTGIGLAMVAAVKGYAIILVMPESMSVERRKLLQGLGAELVLTPAQEGMEGAVNRAQKLAEKIPHSFVPQQFKNAANPQIHYQTTAEEIWRDTGGRLDIFVAGVGTGGTVSGSGQFFKEKDPDIQVVAVEPSESPVLSGGEAGPHMIQGIGAGFVPDILNRDVIDEVVKVRSQDAIAAAKDLIRLEGLLVGISAGANAFAAREIAQRPANKGKRVVTIMCDTSERYLSTLLYYED